jgi:hypothetical protein
MCSVVGFGTKGPGFKTNSVKFRILNMSFPTQVMHCDYDKLCG